jgi:hypothetical protein
VIASTEDRSGLHNVSKVCESEGDCEVAKFPTSGRLSRIQYIHDNASAAFSLHAFCLVGPALRKTC